MFNTLNYSNNVADGHEKTTLFSFSVQGVSHLKQLYIKAVNMKRNLQHPKSLYLTLQTLYNKYKSDNRTHMPALS